MVLDADRAFVDDMPEKQLEEGGPMLRPKTAEKRRASRR